jgi:GDPmannose 4,6-dehydratase
MKAMVTGITGQDGYYLSKLLLEKDYEVHGLIRRSSNINTARLDPLISKYSGSGKLNLYFSDLIDSSSLTNLINKIEPNEIYNLAAQSHVAVSFKNPIYSTHTSTIGTITILESIRNTNKNIKFYQASSSEMYGGESEGILNEKSLLNPKSPYAAGKVFSHNITKIYRESYNIFAVNGILFNHESPHRGETFVTRKISRAVGRIHNGLQSKLTLGNLDAFRDWGFAGDYTNGMYLMMQHPEPEDWVLSTGETHSVREFAQKAFEIVGLNWEDYVVTSKKYERPNEVNHLLGDSSKARDKLNWSPKLTFDELVDLMVQSDIKLAEKERMLVENKLLEPTWEYSKEV